MMPLRENTTRHPACASTPGLKEEWNKWKVFVIDVGICNGCYSCQIACKDEHVGNDWTPYRQTPAGYRPVLAEA